MAETSDTAGNRRIPRYWVGVQVDLAVGNSATLTARRPGERLHALVSRLRVEFDGALVNAAGSINLAVLHPGDERFRRTPHRVEPFSWCARHPPSLLEALYQAHVESSIHQQLVHALSSLGGRSLRTPALSSTADLRTPLWVRPGILAMRTTVERLASRLPPLRTALEAPNPGLRAASTVSRRNYLTNHSISASRPLSGRFSTVRLISGSFPGQPPINHIPRYGIGGSAVIQS